MGITDRRPGLAEESVLEEYRQSESTANVARQLELRGQRGNVSLRVFWNALLVGTLALGPCELIRTDNRHKRTWLPSTTSIYYVTGVL
jgi:hypothetical protein